MTLNTGVLAIDGQLSATSLKLNGTAISATASNINNISGLTTTADKLNFTSGVTSDIQTQIDSKLETTEAANTYSAISGNANLTTVGALASGSIASGFGIISTESAITTTETVTGSKIKTSNIEINGDTIGHKNDTGLIKLENGKAIITGELQVSTLDIGGTNVTADANDINKLTRQ